MRLVKIISGGQTGADQGGLKAATLLGIETGGWAPPKFMTENGPDPSLKDFGLAETYNQSYVDRTRLNVHDSDITVWFGETDTPGYKATKNAAVCFHRVMVINPDSSALRVVADTHEVINIAGNRESKNPGIEQRVIETLLEAWGGGE